MTTQHLPLDLRRHTITIDTGPLLSRRQAAELLGVSKETVYRLVRSGELPAFRVGHQIRISQVAVENYIRAMPPPVYKEE
jgi:excisionase family DNA binding protein